MSGSGKDIPDAAPEALGNRRHNVIVIGAGPAGLATAAMLASHKIDVLIRRGGISMMRVTDDGCGMDHDDAVQQTAHALRVHRSAEFARRVSHIRFRQP